MALESGASDSKVYNQRRTSGEAVQRDVDVVVTHGHLQARGWSDRTPRAPWRRLGGPSRAPSLAVGRVHGWRSRWIGVGAAWPVGLGAGGTQSLQLARTEGVGRLAGKLLCSY
ncbi:hypothetical protein CPLU01_06107 [Colletotrichum plurivorum]|uniref:Uncharacterized protein n=1 Tax=Colletotrichum plurivorum TaxID=2175906 RepID=A0A8H6NHB1_9PEZI|nr:hypothetical protein CPLU01_06107 [Colletotrichum plurivorum]